MNCTCDICNARAAKGQPPLEGISVAPHQHITREELEPQSKPLAKPIAPALTRRDVRAMIEKNNDDYLFDIMGWLAAKMEKEWRKDIEAAQADMDAKIQDLKLSFAWVEGKAINLREMRAAIEEERDATHT